MKFKVGDKVKYVSDNYTDTQYNPLWGGLSGYIVGTIYDIRKTNYGKTKFWTDVKWDNGKINSYDAVDLEFYCNKKSKTNCYKCKSRLQCITRGII